MYWGLVKIINTPKGINFLLTEEEGRTLRKMLKILICLSLFWIQGELSIFAAEDFVPEQETDTVDESSYQQINLDEIEQMKNVAMGHNQEVQEKIYMRSANPYWMNVNGVKSFYDANGKLFEKKGTKKIIDVSEHNGVIDWNKVKASDVDGVIIRVGYGILEEDQQFKRNVSECNRLGIPYGIYLYSYAYDSNFAYGEANGTAEMLKRAKVNLTYPIYYDIENFSPWYYQGVMRYPPKNAKEYEKVILTYINRMEQLGYKNKVHVYSYRSYLQNQLNSQAILSHVSWIAAYTSTLNYNNSYYQGDYGWQYTSSGQVSGVNGRVDISCFTADILKTTPVSVSISPETITLHPGDTYKLKASVNPTGANMKLSWGSDNVKIATVNNEGVIKAIGEGNTSIYVKTWNGKEDKIIVKVEKRFTSTSKLDPTQNLHAVSNGANRIKLSWDPVPYADGYIIYRKNNEDKFSYLYMVKGTEYTDATAAYDTYNFYKVYAYKMVDGVRILGSSPDYVYEKPYVAKVSELKAMPNSLSSIKLTWKPAIDADGYIIYRRKGAGNFEYCAVVSGTAYIDTRVQIDKYNFYRVYAYKNINGERKIGSSDQYAYAKPGPTAISNLRAENKNNSYIKVSWNSTTDADGYIVYRQAPGEKHMTYRYMVKSNTFNDVQISKYGYYFYRVYAYKMVNGKRVISASNSYVYAKK